MEFDESEILEVNGELYEVGWDEHGWFSIQHMLEHPETGEPVKNKTRPPMSFDGQAAETIKELIEDR